MPGGYHYEFERPLPEVAFKKVLAVLQKDAPLSDTDLHELDLYYPLLDNEEIANLFRNKINEIALAEFERHEISEFMPILVILLVIIGIFADLAMHTS